MATSYTNLLGLALPVTGELNGTWGDVVNNSITELVEDAIAGSATAVVTSGDWTLTTTGSGAANQARSAILIPTGTPGTPRSILAPNSSKAYIVDNQSNATVTIKGVTGPTTGVAIAAGSRALVAWSGADFVAVGLTGTVTSVAASVPAFLSVAGSPITSSGTLAISLSGTALPVANGGSGATTLTGVLKGNGTSAVTASNVSLTSEVTGTLPVANGGTGAATLTANNVLLGNGTSALQAVAPSTAGNVLTSNGTTWTSAAPPTSGTLQAIASGSLSDGSTVIVNPDGTVSVVAASGGIPTAGTPVVFQASSTSLQSAVYDSANNRVVIAYVRGGTGFAIVGTVSGESISFGAAVQFQTNMSSSDPLSAAYDSTNNRVVIAYRGTAVGGNFGTAIVGTVSGTSISFGGAVVFESAATTGISATYDSTNNRVVIAYTNAGNSNFGTAIVGTVSGTSISFGTAVVFNSASTTDTSATYDSTNSRVVIAYRDSGNSNYGTAIVGTVSGTSISFGTAVVFESAVTQSISATYDSTNNRVVIAYRDSGNSSFGTAIVGTVSGTSISFGTAVVFNSASTPVLSAAYDSTNNRVVMSYQNGGNSSFGTAIVGTVSGTSISFGTPVVFESATTGSISATYDSTNNRVVIAYSDGGNSSSGTAVVVNSSGTNLTSENFIGISNAAYTNGQTANIQIISAVDDAQTGLTAGQSYYVQNNGTLGLTPAPISVFAGTAVSATKLIIKG